MARLTTSAPAIRAERPEVSQALDDVIHRCLARQPAARFGSAAAVRDALDRARLDPTGAIARPVGPPPAGGPAARLPPPTGAPPGRRAPSRCRRPGPRRCGAGDAPAGSGSCSCSSWRSPAGVVAYLLVSDNESSGNAGKADAVSSLPSPPTRPSPRSSFDPLGDDAEGDLFLANAIDGDTTTAWSTEQYDSFPDGAKDGVGHRVDLDGEYDVDRCSSTRSRAAGVRRST